MHFFTITNRILSFLRSGIIYKFQVWWQQCYFYDKAKRHSKVRMCEHLGISVLAVERGKGDDVSTIKKHLLCCNRSLDFKDLSILTTNNNHFKVTLLESFLINRDHPLFNKNKKSLSLEFFYYQKYY